MEQLDIFGQHQSGDPLFETLAGLKKSEHTTIHSKLGEILVQYNQFGKYQYQVNEEDGVCSSLEDIYAVIKSFVNQIVIIEEDE